MSRCKVFMTILIMFGKETMFCLIKSNNPVTLIPTSREISLNKVNSRAQWYFLGNYFVCSNIEELTIKGFFHSIRPYSRSSLWSPLLAEL